MALYVCENINEDLFVIINKLFSTKYRTVLPEEGKWLTVNREIQTL